MLSNPSDYGVYDLYNTIIGFGAPISMLGMYDALFREYFEREDQQYKYNVVATANRIVLTATIIVGSILIIFNKSLSEVLYGTSIYGIVVVFSALELIISNNSVIIAAPTRIQNQKMIYILTGLINSLSYYLLAILLIHIGYSYYGMIFANIVSSILLVFFFWIKNGTFFRQGRFDKTIAKELFKIGLPLVPTFLIYWVYNSMDKVMIANMLGTEELGIYSIGSKIASISSFIYYAFSGGWSYFVFSTMKDEDQISLNSKVFEYLALISYISLFVLASFIKPIFSVLFPHSYTEGAYVVPYLYLSPLLLMLFQVAGSQFLIIKKSYWSTLTLSFGAIVNIVLNYLLINPFGIKGASIATLVGYLTSVCIVLILTTNMKIMKISRKFVLISSVLISFLVMHEFINKNLLHVVVLSAVSILLCLLIYKNEIMIVFDKINAYLKQKHDGNWR